MVSGLARILTLPTRSVATAALRPNLALADNSLSVVESDGGLQVNNLQTMYNTKPHPN